MKKLLGSAWLDKTCKNLADKRFARVSLDPPEPEQDEDRDKHLQNLMQRKRTLSMSLPPDRSTSTIGHWFSAKDTSVKEWVDRHDEEYAERVRISESNKTVRQKFESFYYALDAKHSSVSGGDIINRGSGSISVYEEPAAIEYEEPVYEEPICLEDKQDDYACTLARLERARRKLEELTRINPIVAMPIQHDDEADGSEVETAFEPEETETENVIDFMAAQDETAAQIDQSMREVDISQDLVGAESESNTIVHNQVTTETKRVANGGVVKRSSLSIAASNLTLIFARDNSKKSNSDESKKGSVIAARALFDAAKKLAEALSKRETGEKKTTDCATETQPSIIEATMPVVEQIQESEAVIEEVMPAKEIMPEPAINCQESTLIDPVRPAVVKANSNADTILFSDFALSLDANERLFTDAPSGKTTKAEIAQPAQARTMEEQAKPKSKKGRKPKKVEAESVQITEPEIVPAKSEALPSSTTSGAKKRGRPRKNAGVEPQATVEAPAVKAKPSKKKQRGGKKKA